MRRECCQLTDTASVSGHSLVNALAPTLPPQYRIILIERNEFVQHAPIVVRALVVPGEYTPSRTGVRDPECRRWCPTSPYLHPFTVHLSTSLTATCRLGDQELYCADQTGNHFPSQQPSPCIVPKPRRKAVS